MYRRFCINCMSEVDADSITCPVCGHVIDSYVVNQRALRPLTILYGTYLIGKVLGEGGFGITYLGLDLNLNMKVAIKEYLPVQFASRNTENSDTCGVTVIGGEYQHYFDKGKKKYENEARRLVDLEELPGIVRVYNFFYENNTAYMVMEYVSGTTMKALIEGKNASMPWKRAVNIMEPVIKSLSVLHANGIIHRDISPDNIMMNDEGHITLIDFGSAKDIENDGKSKTIVLKRGYAPPEQYTSEGSKQGTWTDVYALCATLYRLICGETLPDAFEIKQGNAKARPIRDFEHSIPKRLEAAIMEGLEPEYKYRTQDMNVLYNHLYGGQRIYPVKKIRKMLLYVCAGTVIFLLSIGVFRLIAKYSLNSSSSQELDSTMKQASITLTSQSKGDSLESSGDTINEGTKESEDNTIIETDESNVETAVDYITDNSLAYTSIDMITYDEDDGSVTVTATDYQLTDVVIPEEINGKSVLAISGIGNNVTRLVLPDTVERIESSAFKNCVYMESIFIPASVKYIGEKAFENCMSLSDIYISNGNQMFYVENNKIMDRNGNIYN